MNYRMLLYGIALWLGGTIGLRLGGQYLLHPGDTRRVLILFAVSFPLMAGIVYRLCSRFKLPREQWPVSAIALALPTLLLDPFSSVFFPAIFPNMPVEAAGLFAGWMLWCCAGALTGATIGAQRS